MRRIIIAALFLTAISLPATARVERIEILSRQDFASGVEFGDGGAYEKLRGRAFFALDPNAAANAAVTDLKLAPRNARGLVEFSAEFLVLRPKVTARRNGTLLYEVNNRGNHILELNGFFNIGVTASNPAGDGFLYNTGNVYLWSGWQGDLVFNPAAATESIDVPVARNPDGSSVTGPTFARFVTVPGNVNTQPLPGRGRTPASLDTTKAKLISIAHENNLGVRTGVVEIPSSDWAIANCATTPF